MTRLSKLSRSIEDKVALVTGAASGMGRATARLFADEGARVAVSDLSAESVEVVVREIRESGGEAEGFVLDVGHASPMMTFTNPDMSTTNMATMKK